MSIIRTLNYRCLLSIVSILAAAAPVAAYDVRNYCGDTGVWVQTLGGGGPELDDEQASASYLIWQDGKARVLIDPAPGSSLLFDKAKGPFNDLQLLLISHLHVDHAGDLPAFIKGAYFSERTEPLRIFGPDGRGVYPDTTTFVARLIGPDGAFPYLADYLQPKKGSFSILPASSSVCSNLAGNERSASTMSFC